MIHLKSIQTTPYMSTPNATYPKNGSCWKNCLNPPTLGINESPNPKSILSFSTLPTFAKNISNCLCVACNGGHCRSRKHNFSAIQVWKVCHYFCWTGLENIVCYLTGLLWCGCHANAVAETDHWPRQWLRTAGQTYQNFWSNYILMNQTLIPYAIKPSVEMSVESVCWCLDERPLTDLVFGRH